jgi:hypothetical protein
MRQLRLLALRFFLALAPRRETPLESQEGVLELEQQLLSFVCGVFVGALQLEGDTLKALGEEVHLLVRDFRSSRRS